MQDERAMRVRNRRRRWACHGACLPFQTAQCSSHASHGCAIKPTSRARHTRQKQTTELHMDQRRTRWVIGSELHGSEASCSIARWTQTNSAMVTDVGW